jgi:hypothetical protein
VLFAHLATCFLDTSAFHFLITAWEASVPGSERGPYGTPSAQTRD